MSGYLSALAQQKETFIEITNISPNTTDSVIVTYWEHFFPSSPSLSTTVRKSYNGKTEKIRFDFPIGPEPGNFKINAIRDGNMELVLPVTLVEPGDQVRLELEKDTLEITGRGAEKAVANYQINKYRIKLLRETEAKELDLYKRDTTLINSHFKSLQAYLSTSLDSALDEQFKLIGPLKNKMSPLSFEVLRANIIGTNYHERFLTFLKLSNFAMAMDPTLLGALKKLYVSKLLKLRDIPVNEEAILLSSSYLEFLREKYRFAYRYGDEKPNDIAYFTNNYKGELRDKLVTNCMLYFYGGGKVDSLYQQALRIVETPYCRELLLKLDAMKVGKAAYNFSLTDTNDKTVSMEDLKGKVLFLDFWYTGCKWCTVYYKDKLQEVEKYFHGNPNIQFVSVCIDVDKAKWKNSIASGLYTNNDVLNLYTQGKYVNHPIITKYNVQGYPHQIIIGKDGKNYRLKNIQPLSVDQLIGVLNDAIKR